MGSGAMTINGKRKAASTKEVTHKLSYDDKDCFDIMKIKNIDSYVGSRKWTEEFKKKKNCIAVERAKCNEEKDEEEGMPQPRLMKALSEIL